MFEHEPDSDDDFECYFLKPVNEYNIVDRIKEANKELFDTPNPESPLIAPRKVQFRRILEDYDDGGDNLSIVSVDSENDIKKIDLNRNELNEIKEEEIVIRNDNKKLSQSNEFDNDSEIEEICEDVMEIELEKIQPTTNNNNNNKLLTNKINLSPESADKYQRYSAEVFREISLNSKDDTDNTSIKSSTSEDDLSVIVASYIEKPLNEEQFDENLLKKSKTNARKKISLRKKKKINSKTTTSTTNNNPTDDEIKFNYKMCCEYRNAIESGHEKLPKYTGYLSEYGLTREQWEIREKKLENRKKLDLEKNLKSTEGEIQKMEDNERAFTRWLKNKMRFPVNKTRNMFDFKPKKSKKK